MRRLIAVLTLVLLTVSHTASCAPGRVEDVRAFVTSEGSIPPLVRARMESAVEAIASQILAGRRLDEATAARERDEAVIREVFDKVLVGYSVESVTLETGSTARVAIRLIPWASVIRSVDVDVEVEGMPPLIEEIARRDLADVGTVFAEGMAGLPVAASDWTNGVLKRSLNEYMERHLPEFRADFDVEPGEVARVALTVYPRLPVVRTVDLSMRSDSVPNIYLLNYRDTLQKRVNGLIGVPVAFVTRHEKELAANFAAGLDSLPDFKALGMKTRISLSHGTDMAAMSRSDTDKYIIRIEGWADVSRRQSEDRDLVFRIHVGRRFTKRDEFFLQTDFSPQAVRWDFELGYARHFGSRTRGIARYDVEQRRFTLGFEHTIFGPWLLRYEYRWTDQRGEAALRYRVHDFLGLEYAIDKEDSWLRVIGFF